MKIRLFLCVLGGFAVKNAYRSETASRNTQYAIRPMPKADQGSTTQTDRYTVIPRVLVFVTHREDVLLIKGAPDKRLWANRYNGLGGHVEAGEEIAAAARREVREEAGIEARDLRLRGVVHIDLAAPAAPAPAAPAPEPAPTGIAFFVFSATSETRETRPSHEGSLHWVPLDDLAAYDLVEDVPVLLQRLAGDPAAPPFTARYYYDANDHLQIEFAP
jgi:8-oxo-dGTP diphosphatase